MRTQCLLAAILTSASATLWTFACAGAVVVTARAGDAAGSARVVTGRNGVALPALYDATDGPNWVDNTNRAHVAPQERPDEDSLLEVVAEALGLPINQFLAGVTRDDYGRVVGIDLPDSGARGPIPPELGALSELRRLDLSTSVDGHTVWHSWTANTLGDLPVRQRFLTGPIPEELGQLWKLQELNLSGNFLTGVIPAGLGNLRLHTLNLSRNELTGPIPADLGNMVGNLRLLNLSDNELSGLIPEELGDLRRLQLLDLSNNGLSGSIPVELGNLRNLEVLHLSDNLLSGPIPAQLGNLSDLRSLALGGSWTFNHPVLNQLTGPIPRELGSLRGLRLLDLSANQLTGPIPAEVGDLTELESLDLSANQLTGPVPASLRNLVSLRELRLGNNDLTGRVPDVFRGLLSLEGLHLEENELEGVLPPLPLNTLLTLFVPPSVCIDPRHAAVHERALGSIERYRTEGVQGMAFDRYHHTLPVPPLCPPPPPDDSAPPPPDVPDPPREDNRTGLALLSDGVCHTDCSVVCAVGEKPTHYENGATIPCGREVVRVSREERLEIGFTVTDENASIHDPDYGYFEVLRYRDGRLIETLPYRSARVLYGLSFVRVRRQQYLFDLDGDEFVEFAVVPEGSPGTAVVLNADIYSLKDQIEEWGTGRLLIENDSFVRLDCGSCSKFNPEECEKCR